MVTEIRMKYFDTTPIASSMCVLKTGFLFVASEFGNQYVIIQKIFENYSESFNGNKTNYVSSYAQGNHTTNVFHFQ